ncbi:hypothetical protein [Luteitalea sp.]
MRYAFALSVVMLVCFLGIIVLLIAAFFRGIPDESAPPPAAPSAPSVRRVAVGPPAQLLARLKARLRVCPRVGHTWAIAYPLPRKGRVRQCQACGKREAPMVVKSFRTERAS